MEGCGPRARGRLLGQKCCYLIFKIFLFIFISLLGCTES